MGHHLARLSNLRFVEVFAQWCNGYKMIGCDFAFMDVFFLGLMSHGVNHQIS